MKQKDNSFREARNEHYNRYGCLNTILAILIAWFVHALLKFIYAVGFGVREGAKGAAAKKNHSEDEYEHYNRYGCLNTILAILIAWFVHALLKFIYAVGFGVREGAKGAAAKKNHSEHKPRDEQCPHNG